MIILLLLCKKIPLVPYFLFSCFLELKSQHKQNFFEVECVMSDATCQAKKQELTPYEKKLMMFYVKAMISEISKTIIFAIIFYAMGLLREFGAALFFLLLYRTSSGGLHCKTYLGCLFLSFGFFFLGMLLGIYIWVPIYIIIPATLILAVSAYLLSPVQAPTRPPLEESLIKKAKQQTIIKISIFLILACLFSNNVYICIGFWLLVLHVLQLYIAYQIRRCRKDV